MVDRTNPQVEGFTLVEVLVALAITGLSLSFLVMAVNTGLENANRADEYLEANQRAQSYLAGVGIVVPLAPGRYSGVDGAGFSWRIRVSPPITQISKGDGSGSALGLYPVDVSVAWHTGSRESVVSLHSERVGAR